MHHCAESIFKVYYLREYESIFETVNQWTQGYCLTKKTEVENLVRLSLKLSSFLVIKLNFV
jgi:hypothetical protein